MAAGHEALMRVALDEARRSLREGNNGFGAVVARDGEILAAAHDLEETENDPTAHAELLAIRLAARRVGRDLAGCVLVATHEPCPMCATATVWAGIRELAFGYSIAEAIAEGRRRIPLDADEVFRRGGVEARIARDVLHDECAVLYRRDVRAEVRRLRGAGPEALACLRDDLTARRLAWYRANREQLQSMPSDPLRSGYELVLDKLGIAQDDACVVEESASRLVFHSTNPCPTLEACLILGLDTRTVCRAVSEPATDALLKEMDPRLRFTRNYELLRPYAAFCEEAIELAEEAAPRPGRKESP